MPQYLHITPKVLCYHTYRVVTIAGFAGFAAKRVIILVFAEKTESNIIFHYKMLENWSFWAF